MGRDPGAQAPDLVLLLGDNIYLDHRYRKAGETADLNADLRQKYAAQMTEPHFASLLADLKARGARLAAVWDDHDFLGNNSNGEYDATLKDISRHAFLANLGFAQSSVGTEVYCRLDIDDATFILLDVRYYRRRQRTQGHDAMLGSVQSTWLKDQLNDTKHYTFIGSASVLFRGGGDESWEVDYPDAFHWISALLAGRPRTVVLCGDIHENRSTSRNGITEWVSSGLARKRLFRNELLYNFGVVDTGPLGAVGNLIEGPPGARRLTPLSIQP